MRFRRRAGRSRRAAAGSDRASDDAGDSGSRHDEPEQVAQRVLAERQQHDGHGVGRGRGIPEVLKWKPHARREPREQAHERRGGAEHGGSPEGDGVPRGCRSLHGRGLRLAHRPLIPAMVRADEWLNFDSWGAQSGDDAPRRASLARTPGAGATEQAPRSAECGVGAEGHSGGIAPPVSHAPPPGGGADDGPFAPRAASSLSRLPPEWRRCPGISCRPPV